jgi:parvulin-like peptidyl-prolyl isomerase
MRKNILIILGLAIVAPVKAAIVTDNQGVNIEVRHLDAFLSAAPDNSQLDLLKKQDQLQAKVVQLYLSKAAAAEQKKQALSKTEQFVLDEIINQFYFKLKLEQLSTQNLPDFEPLAKLDYLANQQHYKTPEKVAVEHILISTKSRTEAEAISLIKHITARINKGEDFTVLAQEFSEDPSVTKNQGKLGLFAKGEMVKPFEEAAYSLKIGALSKPVKTDFGYHLLRKYKHLEAGYKSYTELKEELIEKVKNEYVQGKVDAYFDQLKIKNNMQIDTSALNVYVKDKIKALEESLKKTD